MPSIDHPTPRFCTGVEMLHFFFKGWLLHLTYDSRYCPLSWACYDPALLQGETMLHRPHKPHFPYLFIGHGQWWTPAWSCIDFCGGSVVPGSCVGSTILQWISTSTSTVAEPLPPSLTVQAVCFVLALFLVFIVSCTLDGSCSDWDGLSAWWALWFTLWWRKILNVLFFFACNF